ncbi:glycosyltransferase family 2 protein [Desulfofundulus thermocisternus]|uniref:glycosyltransferase family 2 protein n=1 Tax=Desulfofundulus thermocisternus TaxID=42471 RepID=UPI000480774E|nr:glycosyltransferase family 2 protein [Desulfofundulus thermocisternus]
MSTEIILSICMIVKDEEKNLPRCLNSLKPLLESMKAELIVVDTGSIDNTVEIARRYTDRVYLHQWNNSFSDMRNISISYARGKWIFIIDADEELENPAELVSLLKSGRVNKYNTVRFKEKNFLSLDKQRYVVHVTERLFRNDGKFRYFGTIHNQPDYRYPVLNSDIWLVHYGYINDDQELMEKKFKRTSEMLRKELEKDPDHIYYRFQLSRTYSMHKDNDRALEEIRKTYSILKNKFPERIDSCYYVLGEYARISLNAEKYEETLRVCREGIKIRPNYIDLYLYMGYALFALEQKEESMATFQKYFDLYNKYHEGQVNLSEYTAVELYTIDTEVKDLTAHKIAAYLYYIEKYEEALKYLELIKGNKKKIDLLIKIHLKLSNYKILREYYQNLQNKNEKALFIKILEKEKNVLEELSRQKLEKEFAQGDDCYALLNRIRQEEDPVVTIKVFLSRYDLNKLPVFPYSEIVRLMIKNKMNIIPVFTKLENGVIRNLVKDLIDRDGKARDYFYNFLLNEKVGGGDFHSERIYISIASVVLLTDIEEAGKNNDGLNERCVNIFTKYVQHGVSYIKNLYQVERLRLIYKTLDNIEDKFFILMHLARDAADRGVYKSAMRYLKEAVEVYPYMAKLINLHTDKFIASISKGGSLNGSATGARKSKNNKI